MELRRVESDRLTALVQSPMACREMSIYLLEKQFCFGRRMCFRLKQSSSFLAGSVRRYKTPWTQILDVL